MITPRVVKALEFDKVLKIASEFCVLYETKQNFEKFIPGGDFSDAQLLLDKTSEAYDLLFNHGASSIEFYDDMGKLLLATKRRLAEPLDKTEQKQMIYFWQAEIAALKSIRPRTKKDNLQVINDAAKLVAVTVDFCGEKPKADTVSEKILIAAMHECLTNTVSHANGKTMTVTVSEKNGKYTIEITNDGEKPKGEIIEGGGLSGLRLLVERENGTMIIHSTPQFELIIELPQGETL